MEIRFIAYDRLGARRGILPSPISAIPVIPVNDLATLTLSYDQMSPNHQFLENDPEIAIERLVGESWEEIPNARFRCLTVHLDNLEEVPVRSFEFIHVGEAMSGISVWSANGRPLTDEGAVQWKAATAGRVISNVWSDAVGRGFKGFSINFTSTHDSAGQPWGLTFNMSFELDTTLSAILHRLVALGLCDYEWKGRQLNLYNAGTALARDLTGHPGELRLDGTGLKFGVDSAPEETDASNLASHVVVLGEEGKRWVFPTGYVGPEGRREVVLSYSGVNDEGTARLLANPTITKSTNILINTTRQFHLTDDVWYQPFQDYRPGDWVMIQKGVEYVRMRIRLISFQLDMNGFQGFISFGDKIDDDLETMYEAIQRITGGVVPQGTSTPTKPKGRKPKAPESLQVTTTAYITNTGSTKGTILFNFTHDQVDDQNREVIIDYYQVWYRETGDKGWRGLMRLPAEDRQGTYSPLDVYNRFREQIYYDLRIAAVSSAGLYSDSVYKTNIRMEVDTEPPPMPTPPKLSSHLMTIKIDHDGKGVTSSGVVVNMPPDLHHINVYRGSTPTTSALVGVLNSAGFYSTDDTVHDVTSWWSLEAVDATGNKSNKTTPLPITPKRLVDTDKILAELDAAKIQIKNAGKLVLESGVQLGVKLTENATAISDAKASIATVSGNVDAVGNALAGTEAKAQAAKVAAAAADTAAGKAQAAADDLKLSTDAAIAQIIARGQSLVTNGDFEAGQGNWTPASANRSAVETGPSRSGSKSLRIGPNTANEWPRAEYVPSSTGRTYYVEAWVQRSGDAAVPGGVGIVMQVKTTAGGTAEPIVGRVDSLAIPATGWVKLSVTYTLTTANVTHVRFGPWVAAGTNVYYFDDFLAVDVTEAQEALTAAAAAQTAATNAATAAAAAMSKAGQAQTSADGKNNVYYVKPSGTAQLVKGDTWFDAANGNRVNQWTGSAWEAIAYGEGAIENLAITNAKIANLDGAKIIAETITGVQIKANTIGVRSLAVTDLTNFAPSLAESPGDWALEGQMAIIPSPGAVSGYRFSTTPGTAGSRAYGPWLAVAPGESLWMGATLGRPPGDPLANTYLRYEFGDTNKIGLAGGSGVNYVSAPQSPTSPNGTRFEGEATVPTGAAYARIYMIVNASEGGTGFYDIVGRRRNGGELIVDGSITGNHIQAESVAAKVGTFIKLNVDQLTATGTANIDTGVVNKLWTDVVRSRKITTDMLIVGPGSNMLPDPRFLDSELYQQALATSTPVGSWALVNDTESAAKVWRYVGHTSENAVLRLYGQDAKFKVPVQAGDSIRFRHWYRMRGNSVPGVTSLHRWALYQDGPDGVYINYVGDGPQVAVVGTGPTWRLYEAIYTVPEGVSLIRPVIQIKNDGWTGEYEVKDPSITLASDASLIVDGSILSKHMTADSVTARELKALSVSAGHIAANTITGDKINAGSIRAAVLTANSVTGTQISGTAIDGMTITGSTIRTNANAATVGGIQFDANYLRAWAPNGNQTLLVNGNTGDVSIVGALRSNSLAGNQLWAGGNMQQSGASGMAARPGLVFKSDASEYSAGAIYRDGTWGAIMIDSPYSSTGGSGAYNGQSTISVSNHGIEMFASRQGSITGPSNPAGAMLFLSAANNDWWIGGGGTSAQGDYQVRVVSSGLIVRRNSNHMIDLRSDRSTVISTSKLDVAGSFYAVSKNFKIRHPSKEGMDLYHGSTESPVSGVEYWGHDIIGSDGTVEVLLPDYFEALVKPDNRVAMVTQKHSAGDIVVGDVLNGKFTAEGQPGQQFNWHVLGERYGADFEIEQPTEIRE